MNLINDVRRLQAGQKVVELFRKEEEPLPESERWSQRRIPLEKRAVLWAQRLGEFGAYDDFPDAA